MITRGDLRLKLAAARAVGFKGLCTVARHRLLGHRSPYLQTHSSAFQGEGLEVGGPSRVFGPTAYLPIYSLAHSLDNVNFAAHTRWEGDIAAGSTFRFRDGAAPGRQFVHEATHLASIADASYDFVASNHMLEHSANPLRALHEWMRALKPGGTLLLVLPHRDGTFDRYRPVTPLQHMIEDFRAGVAEEDRTHFDEILTLHDLSRDIWQPSREALRVWVEGNTVNRGVHHHVFDSLSAAQLVDHAGLEILCVEPAALDSIVLFTRKPQAGKAHDNSPWLRPDAEFLRRSYFPSDRAHVRGPAARN